jgi:zinc transporter ZupT
VGASAVLVSLAALASTCVGGLCALALRERLPSMLGFATGILVGVVCFELLPESVGLSRRLWDESPTQALAPLAGFLLFHGLDCLGRARAGRCGARCVHGVRPGVGLLSAAVLAGHSVLDGLGIGLAFQVSTDLGVAVACTVVAHDFCDGLATVSLVLRAGNSRARALAMLAIDALAPVIGAAAAYACRIPGEALALGLGVTAGFLLSTGATTLLPQLLGNARAGALAAPLLGASLVFALTRVVA